MTIAEKNGEVKRYCRSKSCDECAISTLCTQVRGAFRKYDDVCEAAYEIIANLSKKAPDNVNHPSHYETGKFECIDVMIETQGEEAVKAYCLCAAFKYLYRHKRKNGLEDIKKARWYLDKYIELEEGKNGE